MNNKQENSHQNRQYEAALACFTAAFALQEQNQQVNSTTLLEHLGKGSLSTTSKYARLWHKLMAGETHGIPQRVLKAYEAAREGSDTTDTAPHEPAPTLYTEFVEQVTQQVAKKIIEGGWLVTQKLIDQEIEAICLDAEQQVAVTERARKDAATALKELESERTTLQSRLVTVSGENTKLLRDLGKLQGRLDELEVQKQEWRDKSDSLEKVSIEQLIKLTALETKLDNAQQQVQRVTQTNDNLEAKLHEQSDTIAALTGQVRAAEVKAAQLEKREEDQRKIISQKK